MKKKKYSLAGNLAFYYKKLYEYAPVAVWRQALYVGLGVVLPLFSIYLPKLMIDCVLKKVSAAMLLAALGGFILLSALVSGLCGWSFAGTYMERLYARSHLICELFFKFLRIDYRFTEDGEYRKKYYAAVQTNEGGDGSVPMRFWDSFPKLLIHCLNFALYSAVIVTLHPLILLLLLVMAAVNYRLGEMERRYREQTQGKREDIERKFSEVEQRCRNVSAAKDIRIFGLEGWLTEKMGMLVEARKELERKLSQRSLVRENVGHGMNAARDFIAYAFLISATVEGRITAGDFVLYLGAIQGFGNFLSEIIQSLQELLVESDLACRYREYYDLSEENPEVRENTEPEDNGLFRGGSRGQEAAVDRAADARASCCTACGVSIDFEDVSFGYEEGKDILSHFTLHIAPGEKIALVGENGAGKTTFVKLLAGFYEPREGKIRIGGADASAIPKRERYRLFSAVFQENKSFPFTVGENLTLQPKGSIDEKRAQEALERAGIRETFQKNKITLDSYMTKLWTEDGVELSGGQMQRFMLARALYQDAPVLLLDEPTAALDPIAESEIYDAYARLTEGKTAIFISHRLASTRFSDRIVLLKKGRILESGTHEELLSKKGAYAAMFALQASYYQKKEACG